MYYENENTYQFIVLKKLYGINKKDETLDIWSKTVIPIVFSLLDKLNAYNYQQLDIEELMQFTNLKRRYVTNALYLLRQKKYKLLLVAEISQNSSLTNNCIPLDEKKKINNYSKYIFKLNPFFLENTDAVYTFLLQHTINTGRYNYIDAMKVLAATQNMLTPNDLFSNHPDRIQRNEKISNIFTRPTEQLRLEIGTYMLLDIKEVIEGNLPENRNNLINLFSNFGFVDSDTNRNDISYFLEPYFPNLSTFFKHGKPSLNDKEYMISLMERLMLKYHNGKIIIRDCF